MENNVADLNLEAPWRIGERAFEAICNLMIQKGCTSLVEFGSGASTVRYALRLPTLHITAFEHDEQYCAQTADYINRLGLTDRVHLIQAPLRHVWLDYRPFVTYSQLDRIDPCDVIVIDGPPRHTRRGREACLYYAYPALAVGGLVILDDAERAEERQILANWLNVYPRAFEPSFVDVGHGLAVLRKTSPTRPRRWSIRAAADSYAMELRRWGSRAKALGATFRRS